MKSTATRLLFCALLIATLGTAGCGSFSTIPKSNIAIAQDLERQKTYCSSIPRIYSGVAYNFCRLHGSPSPYVDLGLELIVTDMVPSLIVDTVALPLTCFQQIANGNVQINSSRQK